MSQYHYAMKMDGTDCHNDDCDGTITRVGTDGAKCRTCKKIYL